jgi:hypothetical protein
LTDAAKPEGPTGRFSRWRAAFVLFHAASIVVLSLPGGLTSEARWASKTTQRDLADWAARLRDLGFDTDKESLERTLQSLAEGYTGARNALSSPFALYARITLSHQGWTMFASPQRRPYELHVDGRVGDRWLPLHRPQDPNADVFDGYFSHDRVRKFAARFGKNLVLERYESFARFLAGRVFESRSDVEQVRVSLYVYDTLPPAAAARGDRPAGSHEHPLVFDREALR